MSLACPDTATPDCSPNCSTGSAGRLLGKEEDDDEEEEVDDDDDDGADASTTEAAGCCAGLRRKNPFGALSEQLEHQGRLGGGYSLGIWP